MFLITKQLNYNLEIGNTFRENRTEGKMKKERKEQEEEFGNVFFFNFHLYIKSEGLLCIMGLLKTIHKNLSLQMLN